MKRVVIESPWRGNVQENRAYAIEAVHDSLVRRGEAPIASHLLIAAHGILDDGVPMQREVGIEAGHAWIMYADLVAIYQDLGITHGMRLAIDKAEFHGIPISYRSIRPSLNDLAG